MRQNYYDNRMGLSAKKRQAHSSGGTLVPIYEAAMADFNTLAA